MTTDVVGSSGLGSHAPAAIAPAAPPAISLPAEISFGSTGSASTFSMKSTKPPTPKGVLSRLATSKASTPKPSTPKAGLHQSGHASLPKKVTISTGAHPVCSVFDTTFGHCLQMWTPGLAFWEPGSPNLGDLPPTCFTIGSALPT